MNQCIRFIHMFHTIFLYSTIAFSCFLCLFVCIMVVYRYKINITFCKNYAFPTFFQWPIRRCVPGPGAINGDIVRRQIHQEKTPPNIKARSGQRGHSEGDQHSGRNGAFKRHLFAPGLRYGPTCRTGAGAVSRFKFATTVK